VDRITRAAERISAEDLSRRLALPLPDDELGRLASAFDAMIARLDDAFQRQRRFTADASHELRTPLAAMRARADVALTRPRAQGYYVEVIAAMREESERLSNLADSLLMLARADSGHLPELADADLAEVLAEVGEHAAARARERGIVLEVTLTQTTLVRGNATWLRQLVLNLLDNAFRHTPPGGRVTLALQPAPDGAVLTVADTGDGIPPEHLPHIFERFYRADPGRARAAGGSGLGLAICDWIARAHGTRLDVQSAPGSGTTFTLQLPSVTQQIGPAPPQVAALAAGSDQR
jgi:heavy metal sensor kinase